MKATVTRQAGFRHVARIRQHEITIDEPSDLAGTDDGPCALELLAASLAGCIAVTTEMYAARKGWDVPGLEVECGMLGPIIAPIGPVPLDVKAVRPARPEGRGSELTPG